MATANGAGCPASVVDAEDRGAELARATRFTVCALGGRPLRSRTLVEAAGRLEVRVRSVQTALSALGASEDSRGWRIPELTTMDLGVA